MTLGKGLAALISENTLKELSQSYIPDLPIEQIAPNPYQPRISVKPESLVDLADSIRENGVIEPLIVTKKGEKRYEIVAGERRWRAAQLAKATTVPVVVKETSPQQMLELAIIENIQRKDLNPLEEATAFDQLVKLFKLTHAEIAHKVGYSRPGVANKIRLLTLPDEVKKYLLEEQLTEGHTRALMGLKSKEAMIAASKIIIRDGLSVRAVEELVRRLNQGQSTPRTSRNRILDEYTQSIETTLQSKFGPDVKLFRSKKGGKIVIPFANDDQLKKIYARLEKVENPAK
ncbi:MAG TPA: ParB/RepB/Spo0J family partition protein [Candidatus Dojkabacteria bacterium]|nr:ParB/RepB/Spo0J family partition protein [Candidatus Dojkabacteria bacterium]